MNKFIFISFALMAWVFYELSGGSDFTPQERADVAADPETNTEIVLRGATVDPAKANEVSRADTDVTFATLTLPQTTDVGAIAAPAVAEPVLAPEVVIAPEIVPEAAPAAAPAPDLRVVAGTLVNMRDGPGIDYAVLATVTQGALAEVIEVDATGWARIRLVDTDQIGWMSERLLTGG